jgi:hypothetical protein
VAFCGVCGKANEGKEGAAPYLTGSDRCTVHQVCAPTGKEGDSRGLAELGGIAAALRGGAAAWRLARVLQQDREEGRDVASGLPGARRKDRAARHHRAASVGQGQGPLACLRGMVEPCASI